MQVQKISFSRADHFNNGKRIAAVNYPSVVQAGAQTACGWFAFGVGLDYVGRKCSFFKSPAKNSLFINTVLAAIAGCYTCIKTASKKKRL